MSLFIVRAGLISLTVTLCACAQQQTAPSDSRSATSADAASVEIQANKQPSDAPQRNYSSESLADLLVAEVAAQRSVYAVTLGYYAQEARQHRDPLVAEQAAKLAAYLNDPILSSEMGEVWLDGNSQSRDARVLLALSYTEQGETEKAAAQIDLLMAGNPREALVELVSQARSLDEAGNAQLLAALGSLTDRYPDQAPLWYARALSLEIEEQHEPSLVACNHAIKLDSTHEDSRLLKARLLFQLNRNDEALKFLKKSLRKYPDAKRSRILYTRLLIDHGDLANADTQLKEVNQRFPEDYDLRFSLALLAMDKGSRGTAAATLNELLADGYRSDEIHLFLAGVAEKDKQPNTALEHYMAVQGDNQLRARIQAARLMHSEGLDAEASSLMTRLRTQHPEQTPALYAAEADMLNRIEQSDKAIALLNSALAELPNNTDLLYSRAMTAERLGDMALLETDLHRLLELKPNDATALNALGYTLLARTERIDEAATYIEAAHAQRPNDAAVIDSLGWLRYRQGKPDEALSYLTQAWEMFPDQEVAAHLGEVLWVLGQQEEARRIWRKGLSNQPDSRAIPEAVLRLTGASQP
ncbi:MAG: tetratricopeptide repeat protein [Gammaproteobacteria bacterium]|nr:tetratricopeptide repeat protein [Gammaproteobacteria bacterium]MBQ0773483.1 tetratricopeptide repeat protein [Gammaproteobacteria bacterium]